MSRLRVIVRFDADRQELSLDPGTITLTDSSPDAIWEFQDLPPGATADVRFGDSDPFLALERGGRAVIGVGNDGPGPSNEYPYQAAIQSAVFPDLTCAGLVINAATHRIAGGPDSGGAAHCNWPDTCPP